MAERGIHGTLVSVSSRNLGDEAAVAVSVGAATIPLTDASDFSEDGGEFVINGDGTVYAYTAADMDADTITLSVVWAGPALAAGDRVDIWDPDTGVVASEATALVSVDDQGEGDPLLVVIDHALTQLLPERTLIAGQSVSVTRDGEEYRLSEVHAKAANGLQRTLQGFWQIGVDNEDGQTVTGIEINTNVSPMGYRLLTPDHVSVQAADRTTFMPIRASAFTVSSDSAMKTEPEPAGDALSIIDAAPASHWRYLTDDDGVLRIGPMADDLPDWMVTRYDDGAAIDAMRMIGVLWAAVAQLQARVADLEKGA